MDEGEDIRDSGEDHVGEVETAEQQTLDIAICQHGRSVRQYVDAGDWALLETFQDGVKAKLDVLLGVTVLVQGTVVLAFIAVFVEGF